MADVGLMFVGAVLFVNGLLLLGKIDAKGAATFNLFVGALQTAIPFYLIATAKTTDDILLASGIFLFGFKATNSRRSCSPFGQIDELAKAPSGAVLGPRFYGSPLEKFAPKVRRLVQWISVKAWNSIRNSIP